MAKLYFRYGAMNSGKSTALLQAAYNYEERGQRVLLAKPGLDAKGDRDVVSRLGVTRPVHFLIGADADVLELFFAQRRAMLQATGSPVACLLIDEAQFLAPSQVNDLLRIAVVQDVPVLAYGIRTDFRTEAFPGSARLLEVAHSLEELKTICRCGRKALFNARKIGDMYVFDGQQVAIDTLNDVTYESLCAACYLAESGGVLDGETVSAGDPLRPDADFS
ncbi:thymidine kinase [uncultured Amnibacterium sp.]|uniref:thymidine kinase n=1 Tax=uncultured Amnibacterium sp. TaxID=1631851 RepID=UPI0035CC470A